MSKEQRLVIYEQLAPGVERHSVHLAKRLGFR